MALNDLQDKVLSMGDRELSEHGLPQTVDSNRFARVYRREIDYDQAEQKAFVEQNDLCLQQISGKFMIAFVP